MIDSEKVNDFWEKRALVLGNVEFESIANLEENHDDLLLKIKDETSKIFGWLPNIKNLKILDLGAGVGQWAFRFAELEAKHVYAVERSSGLVKIGRNEISKRSLNNISFIECAAEDFSTHETFDLVFISGLFVYLNPEQYNKILNNISNFLSQDGLLLIRDGMSIQNEQYEINNQYSEHLNTMYSAVYRTREEYISSIENNSFCLLHDENMFPEGHKLNKYKETRLHLFLFKKTI